jgi:hypothetical protein
MTDLAPSREEPVAVWWLRAWKAVVKPSRKVFDNLVWLVACSLWKERNQRIHEWTALHPVTLTGAIMEDTRLWSRAGFMSIAALLGFRRWVMALSRVFGHCFFFICSGLGPRLICCSLSKLLSS